ncbi:MAG: SIMPL domain-containing protein [Kofleriaceae bacterium]|nr:SIMPL domain-containing protein [Kofleriaceae bacterium]
MKSVHDVAIYAVMGLVFLLAFRATISHTQQGAIIVESRDQAAKAAPGIIKVTGSADMLVSPDEISVDIAYQEYWHTNLRNKKMTINAIEKKILKAAADAGVSTKDISIDSYGAWRHGWNYWYSSYRRRTQLTQKKLTLKLRSSSQLQEIVDNIKSKTLRKEGILSITLSGTSHSKIQEYRKTVKEKAIEAAKDKASYLLVAVQETRGELLSITELKDPGSTTTTRHGWPGYLGGYSSQTSLANNLVSNISVATPAASAQTESGAMDLRMKPIRLQYAIEATFKIAR